MLNRKLWIGLMFALLMIGIGACAPADAAKAISRIAPTTLVVKPFADVRQTEPPATVPARP